MIDIFDNARAHKREISSFELKDLISKVYKSIEHSLVKDTNLNLRFSGSTCVSVLIIGDKLFCANVGDSRAILVKKCVGI